MDPSLTTGDCRGWGLLSCRSSPSGGGSSSSSLVGEGGRSPASVCDTSAPVSDSVCRLLLASLVKGYPSPHGGRPLLWHGKFPCSRALGCIHRTEFLGFPSLWSLWYREPIGSVGFPLPCSARDCSASRLSGRRCACVAALHPSTAASLSRCRRVSTSLPLNTCTQTRLLSS